MSNARSEDKKQRQRVLVVGRGAPDESMRTRQAVKL
jgi:hypothetical protein